MAIVNYGDAAYFDTLYGMGGDAYQQIKSQYAPYLTLNPSFSPDSGDTYTFDEAGYLASLQPAQVANLAMLQNTQIPSEGSPGIAGGTAALQQYEQDPNTYQRAMWDEYITGNTADPYQQQNANVFQLYNQLGLQMGMTPDEIYNLYNSSVSTGYGAGFGEAEDYRQMLSSLQNTAASRGYDLSPYQQYLDVFQQKADTAQAISDADNDFGLAQFLPMVALAALGGGYLLGGGFAAPSAAALGAGAGGVVDLAALGGIAGGGFGSVVPGAATSGIGGALGGGLGVAGSGEGAVGWDALGNAVAGGPSPIGSLDPLLGFNAGELGGQGVLTGTSQGGGSLLETLAQVPTPPGGLTSGGGATTAGGATTGGATTGGATTGGLTIPGVGTISPTSLLSGAASLLGGGGGTSGAGTSGTSNPNSILNWITGAGTGSLSNLISGFMTDNAYEDQGDFLRSQMDRAWSMADPYGYGPYREYAAQQLQKTYQDPLSIWQSPEMQAWDTEMQNSQLAKDAAAGQLFNAPERLAQRERGFLTQLGEYRKPLMQMSGSQFAPDARAATSLAGPIVANELARNMNQGALLQQGLSGLGGLFGTGGQTFGSGSTGGLMNLATSLSGLNWSNLFGGAGSSTGGGWTMQDTNIWESLGNLGEGWGY